MEVLPVTRHKLKEFLSEEIALWRREGWIRSEAHEVLKGRYEVEPIGLSGLLRYTGIAGGSLMALGMTSSLSVLAGGSGGLGVMLALIAAVWNGVFNTLFDRLEGHFTGRTADRRPWLLRGLHAVLFEGILLLLTLPVIVLWTGMNWWPALLADIGLALAYTGKRLPLQVHHSAAGHYIGTADEDGPVSRESVEYFRSQHAADHALTTGRWQQRIHP